MEYSYVLYDSVQDIDVDAWNQARWDDEPLLDPRFLLAVEKSMSDCHKFWYVIVRNQVNEPVGIAALCLYSFHLDSSNLLKDWGKFIGSLAMHVSPRLRNLKLLFCGLPVGAGESFLRFTPNADPDAVLGILNKILCKIAVDENASCIVFREFSDDECRFLESLTALGYLRFEVLPMNYAKANYRDFQDYLISVNCKKRKMLRKSKRNFERCGMRVVQVSGGKDTAQMFTEDVYQLHAAVRDRHPRIDVMPVGFFRELALQLPDQTAFTFIYDNDRIVAFGAALFSSSVYHDCWGGFDYDLNLECELYFNLAYHAIDRAYRQNASQILVGQTADAVKASKLGCYQRSRYIYVKGTRKLASLLIRYYFNRRNNTATVGR